MRTSPAQSPPNWITALLTLAVLAAGFLLALFFFAVFAVLFAVITVGVGLRLWWLRRQLRRRVPGQALEGEYIVIERDERNMRE